MASDFLEAVGLDLNRISENVDLICIIVSLFCFSVPSV